MKQRWTSNLFMLSYLLLLVFLRASKPSPILTDNRINLQCLHDFMLLDMDLQDIPKLKPTSLHLRHFSCRPHQVTNTRAIFRVPFQGCGTTRGIDSNHIVYHNVVDNSQEFNTTRVSVRHAPQLYYPFICRYRQKYVLTLKEGQMREQPNEDGQREENSTSKDFLEDPTTPSSSVSSCYLHYLSFLLLGLHLILCLEMCSRIA